MIDSPSVYVFGEILDHPNILALESDEGKASNPQGPTHVELLRIFAYGTFSDYQTHADKLPGTEICIQGLFLDILKKTQTQKNSKLKPNPEKTQGKSPDNSKSANSTREQLPSEGNCHQKNFFKTLENL